MEQIRFESQIDFFEGRLEMFLEYCTSEQLFSVYGLLSDYSGIFLKKYIDMKE